MNSDKLDALVAASQAIDDHEKSQGNPKSGAVPCPVCGAGTITYIIRGPRAMRAKCSTPGCIVLMG